MLHVVATLFMGHFEYGDVFLLNNFTRGSLQKVHALTGLKISSLSSGCSQCFVITTSNSDGIDVVSNSAEDFPIKMWMATPPSSRPRGKVIIFDDKRSDPFVASTFEWTMEHEMSHDVNPISDISTSGKHCNIVTKSGKLYTFGSSSFGCMGLGGAKDSVYPEVVPALKSRPILKSVCGKDFSIALTQSGDVYSWGKGFNSELGRHSEFSTPISSIPRWCRNLSSFLISDISCGLHHVLAIGQDPRNPRGNRVCISWGDNTCGQLGYSRKDAMAISAQYNAPNSKEGSNLVTKAVLGLRPLDSNGVYLDDHPPFDRHNCEPQVVASLLNEDVARIAAGCYHSVISTSDGRAFSWGANYYGQLGLGDQENRYAPCLIQSSFFPKPSGGHAHIAGSRRRMRLLRSRSPSPTSNSPQQSSSLRGTKDSFFPNESSLNCPPLIAENLSSKNLGDAKGNRPLNWKNKRNNVKYNPLVKDISASGTMTCFLMTSGIVLATGRLPLNSDGPFDDNEDEIERAKCRTTDSQVSVLKKGNKYSTSSGKEGNNKNITDRFSAGRSSRKAPSSVEGSGGIMHGTTTTASKPIASPFADGGIADGEICDHDNGANRSRAENSHQPEDESSPNNHFQVSVSPSPNNLADKNLVLASMRRSPLPDIPEATLITGNNTLPVAIVCKPIELRVANQETPIASKIVCSDTTILVFCPAQPRIIAPTCLPLCGGVPVTISCTGVPIPLSYLARAAGVRDVIEQGYLSPQLLDEKAIPTTPLTSSSQSLFSRPSTSDTVGFMAGNGNISSGSLIGIAPNASNVNINITNASPVGTNNNNNNINNNNNTANNKGSLNVPGSSAFGLKNSRSKNGNFDDLNNTRSSTNNRTALLASSNISQRTMQNQNYLTTKAFGLNDGSNLNNFTDPLINLNSNIAYDMVPNAVGGGPIPVFIPNSSSMLNVGHESLTHWEVLSAELGLSDKILDNILVKFTVCGVSGPSSDIYEPVNPSMSEWISKGHTKLETVTGQWVIATEAPRLLDLKKLVRVKEEFEYDPQISRNTQDSQVCEDIYLDEFLKTEETNDNVQNDISHLKIRSDGTVYRLTVQVSFDLGETWSICPCPFTTTPANAAEIENQGCRENASTLSRDNSWKSLLHTLDANGVNEPGAGSFVNHPGAAALSASNSPMHDNHVNGLLKLEETNGFVFNTKIIDSCLDENVVPVHIAKRQLEEAISNLKSTSGCPNVIDVSTLPIERPALVSVAALPKVISRINPNLSASVGGVELVIDVLTPIPPALPDSSLLVAFTCCPKPKPAQPAVSLNNEQANAESESSASSSAVGSTRSLLDFARKRNNSRELVAELCSPPSHSEMEGKDLLGDGFTVHVPGRIGYDGKIRVLSPAFDKQQVETAIAPKIMLRDLMLDGAQSVAKSLDTEPQNLFKSGEYEIWVSLAFDGHSFGPKVPFFVSDPVISSIKPSCGPFLESTRLEVCFAPCLPSEFCKVRFNFEETDFSMLLKDDEDDDIQRNKLKFWVNRDIDKLEAELDALNEEIKINSASDNNNNTILKPSSPQNDSSTGAILSPSASRPNTGEGANKKAVVPVINNTNKQNSNGEINEFMASPRNWPSLLLVSEQTAPKELPSLGKESVIVNARLDTVGSTCSAFGPNLRDVLNLGVNAERLRFQIDKLKYEMKLAADAQKSALSMAVSEETNKKSMPKAKAAASTAKKGDKATDEEMLRIQQQAEFNKNVRPIDETGCLNGIAVPILVSLDGKNFSAPGPSFRFYGPLKQDGPVKAFQFYNPEAIAAAAKSKAKKDTASSPTLPNAQSNTTDFENLDGLQIDIATTETLEPRCRVIITDPMLIDSEDAVFRMTILKDGCEPPSDINTNHPIPNDQIRSRICLPATVTIPGRTNGDESDDETVAPLQNTISARIPGFESPAASCPEYQWVKLEYSLNGQHFASVDSPAWFKLIPLRPEGDEPVVASKGAKAKVKR